MVYRLELAQQAVQDIADLKQAGCNKAIAKIEKLLLELTLHPKTGTGQIEEEIVTVIVISARGHYR